MKHVDVLVRGAGIVGQSLALSLGRLGLQVGLRPDDPRPVGTPDVRAYALNAASVALLKSLKVWDALPADAATPVYDMHVCGDAHGSAIDFSAWEQRAGELAWIVDAPVLERELGNAVRFSPHVHVLDAAQAESIRADLTALCEGKASAGRAALGVRFERHDYGHSAIAARLVASAPHQGTARQWFRSPDVLALLPFDSPQPQHSYALVWSLPRERCAELMALDEAAFAAALMAATEGAAGDLQLASPRAKWPLAIAQASAWCGPGWVLLGDAAHLVHPLAGQGLNLGLGDVAALAQVLATREPWRALGDERLLARYARARLAPTQDMARLTDGLLHLFASGSPLARELRNRGLNLVDHLPSVKRWLTARAIGA